MLDFDFIIFDLERLLDLVPKRPDWTLRGVPLDLEEALCLVRVLSDRSGALPMSCMEPDSRYKFCWDSWTSMLDLELLLDLPPKRLFLFLFLPLPPDMALFLTLELPMEDVRLSEVEKSLPLPREDEELLLSLTVCILLLRFSLLFDKLF